MPAIPTQAIDAMLWSGYRPAGRTLQIGVLIENWIIPDWIFRAISILESTPGLHLNSIFRLEAPENIPPEPPSPIFELLERCSRAVADADSPLHDTAMYFSGIPRKILRTAGRNTFDMESRTALATADVDIVVRFDRTRLAGPAANLCRMGIWSLSLGAEADGCQYPPYWGPVRDKSPLSSIALKCHAERLEGGRVFHSYSAPTRQGWFFTRNAIEPLMMAGVMLADRLLAVASLGYEPVVNLRDSTLSLEGGSPNGGVAHAQRVPTSGDALKFIASQVRRSLTGRLQAHRRKLAWSIALRPGPERFVRTTSSFVPDGFYEMARPEGSACADPFPFEWQGRDYVLFEEVPANTHRGRLAIAEIHAKGELTPPTIVLERPYHVSYPFVLRHGPDVFLLPETAMNRTVELYRAAGAGLNDWRFEKNLFEGAMLVDTTPFLHDGLWYFFTSQVDYGMRTLLFYSKTLDGKWTYHPCNPISSDASRARSAGALFYRDGKLIRPAQDCSIRYGYAIVLNEVRKLSPSEYEEEIVGRIEPAAWGKGIAGIHTLNSNARWEAIDVLRYVE
jgi:hypothetical protein